MSSVAWWWWVMVQRLPRSSHANRAKPRGCKDSRRTGDCHPGGILQNAPPSARFLHPWRQSLRNFPRWNRLAIRCYHSPNSRGPAQPPDDALFNAPGKVIAYCTRGGVPSSRNRLSEKLPEPGSPIPSMESHRNGQPKKQQSIAAPGHPVAVSPGPTDAPPLCRQGKGNSAAPKLVVR